MPLLERLGMALFERGDAANARADDRADPLGVVTTRLLEADGYAALCDGELNSVFGVSANGQFVVGSGNYGVYSGISCTQRGFVYNQADAVMRNLPPVGTGCQVFTQAEYVTDDGLIACGTDTHEEPTDPSGLTILARPVTHADASVRR